MAVQSAQKQRRFGKTGTIGAYENTPILLVSAPCKPQTLEPFKVTRPSPAIICQPGSAKFQTTTLRAYVQDRAGHNRPLYHWRPQCGHNFIFDRKGHVTRPRYKNKWIFECKFWIIHQISGVFTEKIYDIGSLDSKLEFEFFQYYI